MNAELVAAQDEKVQGIGDNGYKPHSLSAFLAESEGEGREKVENRKEPEEY